MRNEIAKNIQNSMIKNQNFIIYIFTRKSSIPVKFTDRSYDKIRIRIFLVPNFAKVKMVDSGFQD